MSTKLRPPRSQASPGSRLEIIDAAARIFMENGLDKVSMRMIADTVGISAPSIYHHFASKEDLVAAIAEYAMELFIEAVGPTLDGETSPRKKIAAHVEKHLLTEQPRRHLFGIFDHIYRGSVRDPSRRPFAGRDTTLAKQSPFGRHKQRLREVLEQGHRNGEFDFENVDLAVACVLGTPKGILQWIDTGDDKSIEAIARFCSKSVVATLTPRTK